MPITCELVMARHGEAVCNVRGVVGGVLGCTGLTADGRAQARRLAGRLADEHARKPFDAFYATPRLRVRQTAEEIAARLGLEPTIEDDLRGPDSGEGDGRSWRQVRAALGGSPRSFPDRSHTRGAETWNDHIRRVGAAIRTLLERHDGRRILIAGHKETIEVAHTLLLGLSPGWTTHLGFVTDHACLARWQRNIDEYGQVTWRLVAHNDGHHLL